MNQPIPDQPVPFPAGLPQPGHGAPGPAQADLPPGAPPQPAPPPSGPPVPLPPPQPVEPADNWGQLPPPPVPLILSEQRVGAGGGAVVRPGRALLFSHRDGRIVQFPKAPRLAALRRFYWQYEVDVSDHYSVFYLLIPSRSKAAKFRLTVQAGWRVIDPARIVSSRVTDGNAIVASRITDALLPICRSYAIEDDARLERNLAETLGGERPHRYPEGIALFRFSAQVDHDRKSAGRIEDWVDASHQAELRRDGMDRLRGHVRTPVDLYLLQLQQNPDQVHQVIADIQKNREMSAQARLDLFNKMVENDLIQEADLESFRRQIVAPIGEIVTSSDTIFGPQDLGQSAPPAIVPPQHTDGNPPDEEEDVMPGQVIGGSVDGVTEWRPLPWRRNDGEQDGA
ncbi:hypothetical protein AB0L00_18295 [Actinoallomurus sp. NPDC052308]|uniref:hypothetical protein n=1 Tax=Actinoallomurus sp. NPDC052308 TaxID=3155530 RepID=UPI003428DAF9